MAALSMSPQHEAVGLIGVGLLGTALAERLLMRGFRVVGYDLDEARRDALARCGGEPVADVADVPRRCARIVLSLPDSAVVRSVVDELGDALGSGSLLVDTTTGDPEQTVVLGRQLAARGVGLVDATIAGSSQQVRAGAGLLMAGGEASVVESCSDLFCAISRRWFHVGACGSGARMKLIVNLVLGLNRAVLAEGLGLARALGVDPRQALDVLRASPAYARVMDTKGERMVDGQFAPEARLRQHLKDVGLILKAAVAGDQPVPLSAVHAELLQSLVDRGFGDEDNSAIIRTYE